MNSLSYRPEINGLRGIAILWVTIFHFEKIILDSNIFQGGYIGVDIFFVISGYLISTIIFKELKIKGNFSYKNFYTRRVKRLLPVLAIVIIFTLIAAYMLFIPNRFSFTLDSAFFSWLFTSNFLFWTSGKVYGAEESTILPLLHTWSLSVEEQFYIIFPIIITFLFIYLKKKILFFIYIVLIFSLILSVYGSLVYPGGNFFLLPSRIWEILSGSLIAYYEVFKNKKIVLNLNNKIFIITIFFILLNSPFLFSKDSYHPSLITLVPVFSTALIIFFCRDQNFLINKILSFRVITFFGLISYSLYLWHYPIFVFLKILSFEKNNLTYLFIIIFVITISLLSYLFIEKPMREKKYNINILILLTLLLLILLTFLNIKNFNNSDFVVKSNDKIKPVVVHNNRNCYEKEKNFGFCRVDNNKLRKSKDIVFLGDSALGSILYGFTDIFINEDYNVFNLTYGGSPYFPYGREIQMVNGKNRDVTGLNNRRTLFLENSNNEKIIVINLNYKEHFSDFDGKFKGMIYRRNDETNISPLKLFFKKNKQKFYEQGVLHAREDFNRTINFLAKNNKVILIYPLPEFPGNFLQSIYTTNFLNKKINIKSKETLEIDLKNYLNSNKKVFGMLDDLNHKNIHKIFPENLFCKNKKCFFQSEDGTILYEDDIHLSRSGAYVVSAEIIKILEILNKNNAN